MLVVAAVRGSLRVYLRPKPDRLTFCGLLRALSLIENVPVSVPGVVGRKVREYAQLDPGARLLPFAQVVPVVEIEK